MGVLTTRIIGRQDGGQEDRLDPLSDLIPAVIRKLPGFELADPAQVPMGHQRPHGRGHGHGHHGLARPIRDDPIEGSPVHNFVLWLLADLFDSLVEQPGATDLLMRETYNSMAAAPVDTRTLPRRAAATPPGYRPCHSRR
ncbi:hypothetical protein ABT255_50385 [Streptomyces mirabilis]|uniref:hypothetical protein n=1 Tax=Streptomyces mirabilis TaxID=68239 RepID=UPI003326832D